MLFRNCKNKIFALRICAEFFKSEALGQAFMLRCDWQAMPVYKKKFYRRQYFLFRADI
ncbi:Uncharacterized protein dnm_006790 [Desulfonema magnum]|uniref:Uncharacterized protein n=1 Tax=Desulfonema magnum TaxID=45655 RepID=A0A975BG62_9BACT|nr:Uncharacterized protein dnm_006790 [Desulfonema magnum]